MDLDKAMKIKSLLGGAFQQETDLDIPWASILNCGSDHCDGCQSILLDALESERLDHASLPAEAIARLLIERIRKTLGPSDGFDMD